MIERFEEFTSNITLAYKQIIKLKAYEMEEFGLKAAHVMCLFFIGKTPEGLTAGELKELCREDKAGISKALQVLKNKGLVLIDDDNGQKKYRAKYFISEEGRKIFDKISAFIVKTVEACGMGLTNEERNIFYNVLEKIVNNLTGYYEDLQGGKI